MKSNLLVFTVLLLRLLTPALAEEAIPFKERWAISQDKAALLPELSPGTEEYYYYHSIHALHKGQPDRALQLTKEWREEPNLTRKDDSSLSDIRTQAMALIAQQPDHPDRAKTLRRMGIKINHPAPLRPQDPNIPSSLNLDDYPDTQLTESWSLLERISQTPPHQLDLLLKDPLSSFELGSILQKLEAPTHPDLVEWIVKDIKQSKKNFGQHPIHSLLTTDQLEKLASLDPNMHHDAHWVETMLDRIIPDPALYQGSDFVKKQQLAKAVVEFTRTLPLSFRQLKLSALSQKLHLGLANQTAELRDYLEYLQLHSRETRAQASSPSSFQGKPNTIFQPNDSFSTQVFSQNLSDYFLQSEENTEALQGFFKRKKFQTLQARAHLLSGDTEDSWKQKLAQTALKDLKESKELQILETTPSHWRAEQIPYLDLRLKNTPTLIVSTYRLSLSEYIRRHKSLPDITLDTSSLTPHEQRTIQFDHSSFLRFNHKVTFPELDSHGDWLIKVEANRLTSAAIFHKGDIHTLSTQTPEGYLLTFIDENHQPIPQLRAQLGNQTLKADNGQVLVPYTPYPTEQTLVLSRLHDDGQPGRTSFYTLNNTPAHYELHLGALIHKEQLIAREPATIYAQPQFKIGANPLSLETLQDPTFELRATLRDGSTLSLLRTRSSLTSEDIVPLEFIVPEQLYKLHLTLSAHLESPAHERLTIEASREITELPHKSMESVGHIYLQSTKDHATLSALGQNGEPLAQLPLQIHLHHKQYTDLEHTIQVKTNASGQVELQNLSRFSHITVKATELTSGLHCLLHAHRLEPTRLPMYELAETIPIPFLHREKENTQFRLFTSTNQSAFTTELKGLIHTRKQNHLVFADIANIEPGQYTLISNQGHTHRFQVAATTVPKTNWLTHDAQAGEIAPIEPAHIQSLSVNDQALELTLDSSTTQTRVHIIASHFRNESSLDHILHSSPRLNPSTLLSPQRSTWNNGGILSTEQQYIQQRRIEGARLGNMLPEPSLLLQPWELERSSAAAHEQKDKQDISNKIHPESPRVQTISEEPNSDSTTHFSTASYEFLKHPTQIFANLKPDKSGALTLPIQTLPAYTHYEVIVTDQQSMDYQSIALGAKTPETVDLRTENRISLEKNYIPREQIQVLQPDTPLKLNAQLPYQWNALTSRSDIAHYMGSKQPQSHFQLARDFSRWDQFSEQKKKQILTEQGSHELHLFLKLHDTVWFETHVRPVLKNKRHKSFLDLFILDEDLSEYLKPWRFNYLNAAQKALLAHAIPSARDSIVQSLQRDIDQYESSKKPLHPHFYSLLNFTSKHHDEVARKEAEINELLAKTTLTDIHIHNKDSLQHVLRDLSQAINFSVILSDSIQTDIKIQLERKETTGLSLIESICEALNLRTRVYQSTFELTTFSSSNEEQMVVKTLQIHFDLPTAFIGKQQTYTESQVDITDLLEQCGVSFPDGGYATWNPNTRSLSVRNTLPNLNIINLLIQNVTSISASDGFALEEGTDPLFFGEGLGQNAADHFSAPNEPSESAADQGADPFAIRDEKPNSSRRQRTNSKAKFNQQHLLDAHDKSNTKRWIESYYYRQNWKDPLAIRTNLFWLDLAKASDLQQFFSPHFYLCQTSINESLLACALMKLPYSNQAIKEEITEDSITISTKQPCIIVYEDVTEVVSHQDDSLATHVQFFTKQTFEATRYSNKNKEEVTGEFQKSKIYVMSIKVSNLSSSSKTLQIFSSLPAGAIPASTAGTQTNRASMESYGHHEIIREFYFPHTGTFSVYPIQISQNERLIHTSKSRQCHVVDSVETSENASWEELATHGSSEAVLKRLASDNYQWNKLHLIAWRMKDKSFYQKAMQILRESLESSTTLGAYAFLHGDIPAQREWLEQHFSNRLKHPSALNISNNLFSLHKRQTIEWRPLIIERAHILQGQDRLNHPSAIEHYQTLLSDLSWKQAPSTEEMLDLIYFLYLKDRPNTARAWLQTITNAPTHCQIQLDYLQCYDAFYREDLARAEDIAKRTLAEPLLNPWKKRFTETLAQIKQIQNPVIHKTEDLASNQSPHQSIELSSHGHDLLLKHGSIRSIKLNIYQIDLEVLFSSDPFFRDSVGTHQAVEPYQSLQITLDPTEQKTIYTLPDTLLSKNLLVTLDEHHSSDQKAIIDSSTIDARISPRTGTLQVIQPAEETVLPKTYVKVYARLQSGDIEFLKDGYTDLRGQFHYNTNNRISLSDIEEFAVFIQHKQHGAKRILIQN